ncbi:MAG: DUF3108 domain-containing protein [Deltaproteobacteria bacterium]|nr:DUF3108 domain-containing protein [Deltaproteobacteria bacterium]
MARKVDLPASIQDIPVLPGDGNPSTRATVYLLPLLPVALALILLALLSRPARLGASQTAFGPGESLVYQIHYGPVPTGTARILVGSEAPGADTRIWPIVVQARTSEGVSRVFEVRDRFVTLWDPVEARSHGFDFLAREGGEQRFTRARLDPESGRAVVHERRESGSRTRTVDVGPTSHDLASAIFWLRGRPLLPGDKEAVRIFTGAKAWSLRTVVEGRERLSTSLGEREAVRVRFETQFRGKLAARRQILVWFTDDAAHVPVQIQAELVLGSLRAELASYFPGLR